MRIRVSARKRLRNELRWFSGVIFSRITDMKGIPARRANQDKGGREGYGSQTKENEEDGATEAGALALRALR
jgi:hypothetical protein